MRFSEGFIQKVLEANDVTEIIGQHTQLKPSGSGLMGLCPFPDHREKSPSFSVSPNRQVYHCFGCGKSGNIITFLKDFNGLSFRDSIVFLAERAHIDIPQMQHGTETNEISRSEKEQITQANQIANDLFIKQLKELDFNHVAQRYLSRRGLTPDSLSVFQIGYANEHWDSLVKVLKAQKISPEIALKSELVRFKEDRNQYYDFFRSRLIFPIHDNLGTPIAFGGRVLDESQPKYLNSPETPVFHKGRVLYGLFQNSKHIRSQDKVLLVEGYMDVISLYQAGLPLAVAPMGTALTLDQAKVLSRLTKNIIVLFDGDQAGQAAAVRALPVLFQAGLLPKGLFLPENMDPDDFVKKHGAAALELMIQQAPDLFSSLLELWLTQYRATATEKVQWSEKIKPLLLSIPDSRLRSLYISEASWKLGVPEHWWDLEGKNSPQRNPLTPAFKKAPAAEPLHPSDAIFDINDRIKLTQSGHLDLSALQMMLNFPSCWVAGSLWKVETLLDLPSQKLIQKAQELTRQEGNSFDNVLSLLASFVDNPGKLFMDQTLMTFFNDEGEAVQNKYFGDVVKKLQERLIANKINITQQQLKNQPSDNLFQSLQYLLKLRQTLPKNDVAPLPEI